MVPTKFVIENSDKSNLFFSPCENKQIQLQSTVLNSSSPEEFLGINIYSDSTFHDRLTKLWCGANIKLMFAYEVFASQFTYYSSVWMVHHKSLNKKFSEILERSLIILHGNSKRKFEELLNKFVTPHQKIFNIWQLKDIN